MPQTGAGLASALSSAHPSQNEWIAKFPLCLRPFGVSGLSLRCAIVRHPDLRVPTGARRNANTDADVVIV